jgi:hypothetical protein
MGRHPVLLQMMLTKDLPETQEQIKTMDALTYNASSLSVREIFEAHYEGINRCNQALNIVPQLDKATPALRTRLVGEAKF